MTLQFNPVINTQRNSTAIDAPKVKYTVGCAVVSSMLVVTSFMGSYLPESSMNYIGTTYTIDQGKPCDNNQVVEISKCMGNSKEINNAKIQSLSELKPNWDGENGSAMLEAVIDISFDFVKKVAVQPNSISPTPDGYVQMAYYKDSGEYLGFELGETNVISVNLDSELNGNEDEFAYDIDKINELVIGFYG